MRIDTLHSQYRRLIQEVAALIGGPEKGQLLLDGGHLDVGGRQAWFVYDENLDIGHLFVYVDIGVPTDIPEAYHRLLQFNLQLLGSSIFATTGMHPDTGHVIYAYRYPLGSSGQGLMDSVLKVVNGISADSLPTSTSHGKLRTH